SADLIPALEIALSRHAEISSLESEISDLTERFETRKLVERAKSLLQTSMGLSEPEAFRWIQKTSMDRRLTMREVAETVLKQIGTKKYRTTKSFDDRGSRLLCRRDPHFSIAASRLCAAASRCPAVEGHWLISVRS